ncbi:hypothetical protein J1N35_025272 [Gossypium stocksii]|uniref:BAT2 N-terminal domain-containing protein n=1 Tax=Gossypium stocksii TaxID=47602 RepID=A0A9D3V692_9ROSI|nr:hypothetical protein J1N35_025272 [Gossypium stocksii]
MANSGGGNKFVSVNLNKSYGQQPSKQHYHSHHSGSYVSNRTRTGAGSGGMVVLSRPRSSQKTGSKLSVPPPLNLPSLRKEHERFDSLGSSGVPASGGVSVTGPRPGSSGMGWAKPGSVAWQEKEGLVGGDDHVNDGVDRLNADDGMTKASSGVYMPPSVRSGSTSSTSASAIGFPPLDKATVLKREEFPSLQAALPVVSGAEKKQTDGLNQKQKQLAMAGQELSDKHGDGSQSNSVIDMLPQLQSGRIAVDNGLSENGGKARSTSGSRLLEQGRKQDEYFPGPLPLVSLNPRSDWADDERDTGHVSDHRRDQGYSKTEAYWDRDFNMPRAGVLPHKPAHGLFDRRGLHDNDTGRTLSSEVAKLDPYGMDAKLPSREGREGNAWRASSPLPKDGIGSQEIARDRNSVGTRPSSMNREKENKYISSPFRDNAQGDNGRRDLGYGNGGRQAWNNSADSFSSRGSERNTRERYGNEQYNRHKGDAFQNTFLSKPSFPLGGKALPVNDPILNISRDKRPLSKNEKSYLEDPLMKDIGATRFDGWDPFSANLVGVVKRKKDTVKQTDFHDPVRESFEAELERVQKMQEQERQRIIEEQERALEQARREEEERLRLAREQEEQQRRLEEEAREAAWRAEQERLEALRRAEEQRIAREEEKRRIVMEEERRKQAAKQKLIELEERIAKRQAEGVKGGNNFSTGVDEKLPGMAKERDVSKATGVGDWENGERMVERITTSASSDSSGLNRSFELTSRPNFSNASSSFSDRDKPFNSWRRDVFEYGNSSAFTRQETENGHHSPRQDVSAGSRPYSRKEFQGAPSYMSSRPHYRAGVSETSLDNFGQPKGQRWNVSGAGVDHYGRSAEFTSEYHENLSDNYGDVTWGQRSHGNIYPPYPERLYHKPEDDGLYSFGRSRYSVRQPRVLPPPSLSPMQKSSYRGENEHPGPSTFLENEIQYNQATRCGSSMENVYDGGQQDDLGHHGIIDNQRGNTDNEAQKLDGNATRCDSQSSLSVSSPPDSPIHLSHDDLDESGGSTVLSAEENKEVNLSRPEIEPLVLPTEAGKQDVRTASSSISAGDDEEWTVDNNEQLQEQEEYDEDEDGYQEEDEVHEGDDGNIDLTQELDELHLEDKETPDMMDNLVLGFNEGVEVGMPNDEFERSSRKDSSYAIKQIRIGPLEENISLDSMHSDTKIFQTMDAPCQEGLDSSSRIFQETENEVQDLVIQPNTSPQASAASKLIDHVDVTGSSGMSTEHNIPDSVNSASHSSSSQSSMPTTTSVPNHAEVPVKLQFGLFSGPSLIPSPVPAIQIGSIQMPLHLHPPVCPPSLTQMHPTQPPLFQFGQLRYTSPISQGVLPLAPQSVSFVQPNVRGNFSLNLNPGVSLPVQPSQDTSGLNMMKSEVSSPLDDQSGLPRSLDLSQGNVLNEGSSTPAGESRKSAVTQHGNVEISNIGDNAARSESGFSSEDQGHKNPVHRNFKALSNKHSEGELQTVLTSSHLAAKEKDLSGLRGQTYSSRGKKYVFTVKGSNSRSAFLASEASRQDSSGYQRRPRRARTEFRIRENSGKKHSFGMVSSNHPNQVLLNENSSTNGRGTGFSARNRMRKVVVNKSKQTIEFECSNSAPSSSQEIDSGNRNEKGLGKDSLMRIQNIPHSGKGNLKRNIEEDVDAPLQSGIVRVYEQPGIEAASDEDDFIEVRSKRQVLNDRREQREKEIKAKSQVAKPPRKPRSIPQSSNRNSASASGVMNNVRSDLVATEGRNLANSELSAAFSATIVSQPLAPIGTPATKTDAQADIRTQAVKSLHTSSLQATSGGGPSLVSGLMFESKNKIFDNVQASLGSWGNSCINQKVMTLTQTQLDDAMKPVQFDTCAPAGDSNSSVTDPSMPSSSLLLKDKSFSSAASPINSLLAGEKIQFGAVTSPTVIPPSSRAVSHGIGPPGPSRSEIQIPRNLSAVENDCTLFFEKEKHPGESCVHMEDCEAEAAASAVAVAAITSDEIGGNGMSTCIISASDNKGFGGAAIDVINTGDGGQKLASQSKAEESLSVSLPADLSVENPPISLWPPLPSPQNSSSQMISHFPGGPPSHFPFYDMNPMMGGPIFAFGPHEESSSTQSQSQKSSTPASGPLGTWQQCHSGVDSFYGPPTGFTGHFITPPGGIPGVQGPPHMVVYNHFAPVGQFGLSFMGTTYIPSGKQPDWKHNPASSAVGEGDVNNLNMAASQGNSSNIPAQMQHLPPGPGSPLLPIASPLAMFDVSPFQSTPDVSVQARWSPVPASPMQSATPSIPLQQQAEGVLHSQFSQGPPLDQSLTNNRFPESRTSTSSDCSRKFPVAIDATITQLPDELGLVEPSSSSIPAASAPQDAKSPSLIKVADAAKNDVLNNDGIKSSGHSTNSALKSVQSSSQQKNISSQHYGNSSWYNHPRGNAISQKNGSGEWTHRRMGFQGRNQSMGGDKNFPTSKMKQIYVAKQTNNGTSTSS